MSVYGKVRHLTRSQIKSNKIKKYLFNNVNTGKHNSIIYPKLLKEYPIQLSNNNHQWRDSHIINSSIINCGRFKQQYYELFKRQYSSREYNNKFMRTLFKSLLDGYKLFISNSEKCSLEDCLLFRL